MESDRKEALGFVCRWFLLAMASAGVAAAAYVGVVAASPRQDVSRAIVSDGVSVGPIVEMPARLVPRPRDWRNARLLLRCGGQLACAEYQETDPFYLKLQGAGGDDLETRVFGVPYVYVMFGGDPGRMRLLPPGRRVFLIDSSVSLAGMGREPALWGRALVEMKRRGDLVFFHPGPAEDFEAFRADLRRKGLQAPVVCAFAEADPSRASLARAYYCLGGNARKGDPGDVLTDRESLAVRAAGLQFRSHWFVPPGAARKQIPPGVQAHHGLEDFIRSFAGE